MREPSPSFVPEPPEQGYPQPYPIGTLDALWLLPVYHTHDSPAQESFGDDNLCSVCCSTKDSAHFRQVLDRIQQIDRVAVP